MPRGGSRPNTGGAREGAGRKPGSGWKPTVATWRESAAAHAAEIVGTNRDPLLFMIDKVFDDSLDPQLRYNYAKEAAKYLHPTLSASQVNAQHVVIRADSAELLGRLSDRIAKLTGPATIDGDPLEQADGEALEAPEPVGVLPP
jgi:hypothetical protein